MLRISFILFMLLVNLNLTAQIATDIIIEKEAGGTLVLIDRPAMKVSSASWDSSQVFYVQEGKKRQKSMDITKVYSFMPNTGEESVIYQQDTLEGNWYTSEQMKDYIAGQNDAFEKYKPKANKTAAGGVMFGFIGSATGLFYGPLFVIGYTTWKGNTKASLKEEYGFKPEFADNPYYIEGFGTMAKRYTIRRSALGSAAGYILGAVTLSLVLR